MTPTQDRDCQWPSNLIRTFRTFGLLEKDEKLSIKEAVVLAGIEWREFVRLAHDYDPSLYRRYAWRDRNRETQTKKKKRTEQLLLQARDRRRKMLPRRNWTPTGGGRRWTPKRLEE